MTTATDNLVEVRGLVTAFATSRGLVRAVDGVELTIRRGETVCLVGESGSGKSVTGQSLMRLIEPPGSILEGRILMSGRDLLALSEADMNTIRGREIGLVFQEPMTALNPGRRAGEQIAEVLRIHLALSRKDAMQRAIELLAQVGIPHPELRACAYPHQLSGGQRQRVMIAIAIACKPALIIADEPTTALDVTVQAQILELLIDLQHDLGSALLFITHDLGVVAEIADRVVVLYAGQVVEDGPVKGLFHKPLHPYTQGLLACVPDVDAPHESGRALSAIPGVVPSLLDIGEGCRFRERCAHAHARCEAMPPLAEVEEGRRVRCWLHVA